MIHLDTSFLVDLLREKGRRSTGRATHFLESLQVEDLWVSVHVACELQAAAVIAGAALVTGNPRHFSRIPDLEVLTY